MDVRGSFDTNRILLIPALAVFIAASAAFIGCSGEAGQPVGPEAQAQADIALQFPEGYTYDPGTGAIYPPSGQYNASAPSYVTSMTLVISGDDMETLSFPVDLNTLAVTFSITPGIRTFTIIVTTSIGLTFTDSVTLEVVSGGPIYLEFNLNINAPPSGVSASATPDLAKPGDVISLSCQASDLDPGDVLTYTWSGPNGWTATGQNATYEIPNYGTFTFTCTVSDGWGGHGSASVTVRAPMPNMAPVVKSVSIVEALSNLPPSWGYLTPWDTANIYCSAQDPDGDPLTYTLSDQFGVLANGPKALNVAVPNLGGCPPKPMYEDWVVTCTVNDGKGGTASGVGKMPVGWCF